MKYLIPCLPQGQADLVFDFTSLVFVMPHSIQAQKNINLPFLDVL